MRVTAAAFLALLLCGCETAPVRIRGELELQPANVQISLRFEDLKTEYRDPLGQLLQYELLLEHLGKPSQLWPWAPNATAVSAVSDGKKLDVLASFTMPRKQFDECARAQCGGQIPEGCHDFWVKLCDGKYALADKKGIIAIAPTPESWPETASKITFAYEPDDRVAREGASLLGGKRLADEQSADAPALMKLWHEYPAAFRGGDAQKCEELAKATMVPRHVGAEHLMLEILRRERQQLLWNYLQRTEEGRAITQPPPRLNGAWDDPYGALLPKVRLKSEAALRLRVAYDVGAIGFLETGYVEDPGELLRSACKLPKSASADQKNFCALLLVGAGP